MIHYKDVVKNVYLASGKSYIITIFCNYGTFDLSELYRVGGLSESDGPGLEVVP